MKRLFRLVLLVVVALTFIEMNGLGMFSSGHHPLDTLPGACNEIKLTTDGWTGGKTKVDAGLTGPLEGRKVGIAPCSDEEVLDKRRTYTILRYLAQENVEVKDIHGKHYKGVEIQNDIPKLIHDGILANNALVTPDPDSVLEMIQSFRNSGLKPFVIVNDQAQIRATTGTRVFIYTIGANGYTATGDHPDWVARHAELEAVANQRRIDEWKAYFGTTASASTDTPTPPPTKEVPVQDTKASTDASTAIDTTPAKPTAQPQQAVDTTDFTTFVKSQTSPHAKSWLDAKSNIVGLLNKLDEYDYLKLEITRLKTNELTSPTYSSYTYSEQMNAVSFHHGDLTAKSDLDTTLRGLVTEGIEFKGVAMAPSSETDLSTWNIDLLVWGIEVVIVDGDKGKIAYLNLPQ